MRFHDLRHSAATLLFRENVHPKVVQELLGHSTISITLNVYSHMLPGMQHDAISRLNSKLVLSEDFEVDGAKEESCRVPVKTPVPVSVPVTETFPS